jgi:hypothetical protein
LWSRVWFIPGDFLGYFRNAQSQPPRFYGTSRSTFLFWDLQTLATVAAVLAASSLLGNYIPAHRAASANPSERSNCYRGLMVRRSIRRLSGWSGNNKGYLG